MRSNGASVGPARTSRARGPLQPDFPLPGSLLRSGGSSFLLDDLLQQLLGVILVPGHEGLPRGDPDLAGLPGLPLDRDGDLEIALGPLDLSLVAAVLHL